MLDRNLFFRQGSEDSTDTRALRRIVEGIPYGCVFSAAMRPQVPWLACPAITKEASPFWSPLSWSNQRLLVIYSRESRLIIHLHELGKKTLV